MSSAKLKTRQMKSLAYLYSRFSSLRLLKHLKKFCLPKLRVPHQNCWGTGAFFKIDHYFERYCTCCRQWPHLYPAPTGLSTYNTLAFLFHENLFRVALALVLENSGKGRSSWDLVLLPLRHLLVELLASLLTAVALIGPFSLNSPYSEVAPGPPWNEWGWLIKRFENCFQFIETITIYDCYKTTNDQLKSVKKVWAFVIIFRCKKWPLAIATSEFALVFYWESHTHIEMVSHKYIYPTGSFYNM